MQSTFLRCCVQNSLWIRLAIVVSRLDDTSLPFSFAQVDPCTLHLTERHQMVARRWLCRKRTLKNALRLGTRRPYPLWNIQYGFTLDRTTLWMATKLESIVGIGVRRNKCQNLCKRWWYYRHHVAIMEMSWWIIVLQSACMYICMSVCRPTYSVRLFVSHISEITYPNFAKFPIHVIYGRVSVLIWRQCKILCVLPVLQITLRLYIMVPYVLIDLTYSPQGVTMNDKSEACGVF